MASNALTSSVFITFPNTVKTAATDHFKLPLRWWNTYYKSQHHFTGGFVETRYDLLHRNYDQLLNDESSSSEDEPVLMKVKCPYCDHICQFSVEIVHSVKGHIHCPFCKKQYGIHPNGQIFVVRDLNKQVKASDSSKDILMKWLQYEAYQNDWELEPQTNGVNVILAVSRSVFRSDEIDNVKRRQQEAALLQYDTRNLDRLKNNLIRSLEERGLEYDEGSS